MKKRNRKERTRLLLGVVRRKFIVDKRERVARDRDTRESPESCEERGEGKGERNKVLQPRGQKVKEGWVAKMARLYRQEQPSCLGWRVQSRGGVCNPG